MKMPHMITKILISTAPLLLLTTSHAGSPLWLFTPLTPTSVSVSVSNSTGATIIQYLITNQSKKPHTLVMTPIKGITQITTPGNCSSTIPLSYKQSCTLTLEVRGSELQGDVLGGPTLCQQGNRLQCYQPSQANSLAITQSATCSGSYASGRYYHNGFYYPFLACINNNLVTYPISVNTLPLDTIGESGTNCGSISSLFCTAFNTLSCVNGQCITAGSQAADVRLYPFLAGNSNQSWIYEISSVSSLPSGFLGGGAFVSSSCTSSTCIAGGAYQYINGQVNPLLAKNSNNGAWGYTIDATTNAVPTPDGEEVNFGEFKGAQCLGSYCITAGFYQTNEYGSPLLAQSTDAGLTWSYLVYHDVGGPPDIVYNHSNKNGSFNSESCIGNYCIAAGSYYGGTPNGYYPVVAHITNNTVTYPVYDSHNQPLDTLADPSGFTGFNSTSCAGTLCLAVGRYYNGSYLPVVAQNQNDSPIWNNVVDSLHPVPASRGTPYPIGFNSVSCSNSLFCVAVGQYYNGTNYYPLVAVTNDGGNNWSYPYGISALPADAKPASNHFVGDLYYVNCNQNTCMAGGNYTDGTYYYPLLVTTQNNGSTWTNRIYSSAATLPADASLDTFGYSAFLSVF